MPSCFQLTRKGEAEPSSLALVDQRICTHFSVSCDEVKYYHGWYDYIGLMLAVGKSFGQIDEILKEGEPSEWSVRMREINAFLAENYSSDAWREFKS